MSRAHARVATGSVTAACRRRSGLAALAVTVFLLLLWAEPAAAQIEWANRIFGNAGAGQSIDHKAARRESGDQAPPDDLRSGEMPIRNEAMLQALDLAYGLYKGYAQKGGWRPIPGTRTMRPGDDDERVPLVRRRLLMTGELRSQTGYETFSFDGELEQAVRRYQKLNGLTQNGRVDRPTIAAMNVPVQTRLAQIKLNYDRIANLIDSRNGGPEDRYILVNAPAFQLEAVERGKVVQRHRIIVGRGGRETPVVKASVRALNFFPYWRVPDSIAQLDVAPRLIKEPEYLAKEQIRVLSGNFNGPEIDATRINWSNFDSKTTKLRQDPGPQNALGLVRLDMPNEHGVYMHDTPMKPLFGRYQRAFSAGCVRVEGVFDLAAWIARDEAGGVDRRRVDDILAAGQPMDITLQRPVPVYFVYLTAWANEKGTPEFRPDIYGRDGLNDLRGDREHDPEAPPPPAQGLAP